MIEKKLIANKYAKNLETAPWWEVRPTFGTTALKDFLNNYASHALPVNIVLQHEALFQGKETYLP